MLTRKIKVQLAIFTVVTVVSASVMLSVYLELPSRLFGLGHYTVTLELPEAAGLYARGNVTYRGTEVGRVDNVELTNDGVSARLSLDKSFAISSDLRAEVHSQSAVGEQFVDLIPRNPSAPPLKDGDVIPESDTAVPPDINTLLDATNRGLSAIPRDNLKTLIDESYTAAGGLGPEISRIVRGSTQLAKDARANLDGITNLIDQSAPVLTSQADTADDIRAWAKHLASITGKLRAQNGSVTRLLEQGGPAAEEGRKLLARMQPTLPVLLANLVSIGDVALTYRADLEQLLVLVPQGLAEMEATDTAGRNTKHPGTYLDFKLNLNLPPPCTTGYLPPQQVR
ncbi:MAG: MCE family protein, partial [Mycobacterium sp.]